MRWFKLVLLDSLRIGLVSRKTKEQSQRVRVFSPSSNSGKEKGQTGRLEISSVSSVAQLCPTLCDPMNRSTPGLPVHHQLPEFTQIHVHQWCHPAISSSVIPFSSCSQSLPASESFPMSQLFTWGGQSTGVSASASFLPKKSQGWSPSEWTGWISLQSKGPLNNLLIIKLSMMLTRVGIVENIECWKQKNTINCEDKEEGE